MPMSSWLRRRIDRELSLQDFVEAFLNIQQQNNLLFSCCNSLKAERCPPPRVNPPIQPIAPVDSFPLPSKFEGANNPNQADMWPKWLRHFEPYRTPGSLGGNGLTPEKEISLAGLSPLQNTFLAFSLSNIPRFHFGRSVTMSTRADLSQEIAYPLSSVWSWP